MLKAGMMAHVTIRGPEVQTMLAPKDALVRTTRGTNVFIFEAKDPSAKFDPEKPTMGSVRQIAIEADLAMSDGERPIPMIDDLAAATGDAKLYDAYVKTMRTMKTPDEYYDYFYSLARFRDPALVRLHRREEHRGRGGPHHAQRRSGDQRPRRRRCR